MGRIVAIFAVLVMSLVLSRYKEKMDKNELVKLKCDSKSITEITDDYGISMIDVKPSQWFLPEQIKTPKYNCKMDSDWPDEIKCPSHHPYIWSKLKTIKRVPVVHSKYGGIQCSVSIICSNIYDADAVGVIWSPGLRYLLGRKVRQPPPQEMRVRANRRGVAVVLLARRAPLVHDRLR